ncbi:MAG: prepilin-type N-terminal cleavage/methylation domain-containing protein [Peptostreptococcaceae bacterium]
MPKNNKGFTLLEVLVVISILTIILFIGNKMMIDVVTFRSDQRTKTEEMSNITLAKKYLTNDLKASKSIEKVSDYIWKIKNSNDEDITYYISLNLNEKKYSLDRVQNGNSIQIISEQKYYAEPLFNITEKDSLYTVELFMKENNYKFEVMKRITSNL